MPIENLGLFEAYIQRYLYKCVNEKLSKKHNLQVFFAKIVIKVSAYSDGPQTVQHKRKWIPKVCGIVGLIGTHSIL